MFDARGERGSVFTFFPVFVADRIFGIVIIVEAHHMVVVDRNPGTATSRVFIVGNHSKKRQVPLRGAPIIFFTAGAAPRPVNETIVGLLELDVRRLIKYVVGWPAAAGAR